MAVKRLPGEGPLVEERVSCSASGELEVSLALDDGFATAVKIARKA